MLKLSQLNMDYVDHCLTGRQFEFYFANIIRLQSGYKTYVTPASNDHGLDIIYNSPSLSKNVGIQVKLTHGNSIGYSAEEETLAGIKYYDMVGYGVVLTNGFFSSKAQRTAKKLGLTLWNRHCLSKFVHEAYNIILEKQIFSGKATINLNRKEIFNIDVLTRLMNFKSRSAFIQQMISEYKKKHFNTVYKLDDYNKFRDLAIKQLKIKKRLRS